MPETTGAIILTNEQPVDGCTECKILWFNLVNYRNQFRMRPTETRAQNAFDMAQDDFLQHYKDEHQQEKEEEEDWEDKHEWGSMTPPWL